MVGGGDYFETYKESKFDVREVDMIKEEKNDRVEQRDYDS